MKPLPSFRPRAGARLLRALGILVIPLSLWALFGLAVSDPLRLWLYGQDDYDSSALKEWLEEARGSREALPEMVRAYLYRRAVLDQLPGDPENQVERFNAGLALAVKREEIQEHLQLLGLPATRMYNGQLPLFPIFYRLEVQFQREGEMPITWDSGLPTHPSQYQELSLVLDAEARVVLRYQLHAYNKRQVIEQQHRRRLWLLSLLALGATALGGGWAFFQFRRDLRLDAEQRHAQEQALEAERLLLEQRLATQAAEQHALELKSQIYASIGIMAGSYAHNIKNLLVRPNDLIQRCLEQANLPHPTARILQEVQQTLGTVTERLQQILQTVRRNPTQAEVTRLDLNHLASDLERTWCDLARDRWRLEIQLDLTDEPLWIQGDPSHLMQAVENLLFNARDATYEMRGNLRDRARQQSGPAEARKQALLAAASWRGRVVVRTRRLGERVVLEVQDNGLGMSEEVRQRCCEPHFTTKRDSAIHAGNSTGMGLGLSFVVTILEQHHARLEVDSEPGQGATFRVIIPAGHPSVSETGPSGGGGRPSAP